MHNASKEREMMRMCEPPIRETIETAENVSPLQLMQENLIFGTMGNRGLQPMGAPVGEEVVRPASCCQGPSNSGALRHDRATSQITDPRQIFMQHKHKIAGVMLPRDQDKMTKIEY